MAATPGRQSGAEPPRAAICDAVPVMIWQASPDGLLNYFNERVFEYSGSTHEQLAGSGWMRLLHPDDRQRVVHRWAYSLATRAPYATEFRIRKRDKSYRWFLVQAMPAMSADERHPHWVGACTEIEGYGASLPGSEPTSPQATEMLHEATWAPWLHQQAIERVARKATAREASRTIAHVLNQPLTAILSNAQALQGMLRRSADPIELNNAVGDVVAEVRRAIQVLRDWRVTLQGAASELCNVSINDIVRDAAALVLGDLVANRCELELRLSLRSPMVRADVGQMQYALAMLIMSACEAMSHLPMDARGIQVRTSQHSLEHVCIEVADHGPGVRSGVLRVFESPQGMRLPGSGMGISICKGIVEAHGGRLRFVRGCAAEGMVLRVELPAVSQSIEIEGGAR